MEPDVGRSPDGSGHSAKPEPEVVSAVPVSVPNAKEMSIAEMYRNGEPISTILRSTGCSTLTLYKAVDKAGVPRRQKYTSRFRIPQPRATIGLRRVVAAHKASVLTKAAPVPTPPQPFVAKLLEYELVDLLGDDKIGETEREAIRVLIFFCCRKRREASSASAIEARSDATPKSGAAEGESPVPKGDAHA